MFSVTSESVTEGHPDKAADQISDSIVNAALRGGIGLADADLSNNISINCHTLENQTNVQWHYLVRRKAAISMNRFEQAVHDCMVPTAKLLDQTTNPLHRAMLFNFWRHVHLEGSGQFGSIVAPDMMVDNPVYRITWGTNPAVIEGKDGVVAFYNSVGEAVLWNSDDWLAVADWGIADELTFHQLAAGSVLRPLGYDVDDLDAVYHVSSRQAFIWPYDERGRLAGENLYEDKTSLRIEQIDPAEATTPARVREIHRAQLARLEEERGDKFWVL